MEKKIGFAVLGALLVISMALASCSSNTTTTTTSQPTTPPTTTQPTTTTTQPTSQPTTTTTTTNEENNLTVTLTKLDGTKITKTIEKPEYGGTITMGWATAPVGFDQTTTIFLSETTGAQTGDVLLDANWLYSAAGTNEYDFTLNLLPPVQLREGVLATSWDIPEAGHIIFHIRQGVDFQLNTNQAASKLVNGRQMDATDIAWTFSKLVFSSPKSWQSSYKTNCFHDTPANISATDKWTLDLKGDSIRTESILGVFGTGTWTVPHEVYDKYGDMSDWHNVVMTGPYMLNDYVSGSSATFIRNPNYWQKDPVTGMQLPYADEVKYLIIPDASTQLAAMRTGKIDQIQLGSIDTAKSLMTSNPELKYLEWTNTYPLAIFPLDNAKPFNDLNVRKALMMATDKNAIATNYFGGHAQVDNFPCPNVPYWSSVFTPLSQEPADIQSIYTYNVAGAKALLATAGYPTGFTCSVVCSQSEVDELTIVQAQWALIGVTLNLDVKDDTSYQTIAANKTYTSMLCFEWQSAPEIKVCSYTMPGDVRDYTKINDATMNNIANDVRGSFYPDETKQQQIIKTEELTWRATNVPWITLPTANQFTFWQPWLMNYAGQYTLGYCASMYSWPKYCWVDQDLKEESGH